MARSPSVLDVATLSRADWELLCKGLTILLYGAQPVEDAHGKGNGLDAWGYRPPGVEGWQFRRYDERFGDAQVRKVRKAIKLASERSRTEMGATLKRFTLVVNIDLEPGHMGKTGEIERWSRIEKFARTLGVTAEFRGSTWVHTQLLKYPHLRPDLFENLVEAVSQSKTEILEKLDTTLQAIKQAGAAADFNEVLQTLTREARLHYERGIEHASSEDFIKAAQSLKDALRLVEGLPQGHRALLGQVLLSLAGIELTRGRIQLAEDYSERAVQTLDKERSRYYFYSVGSLALCLNAQQRYAECEPLLLEVLAYFEEQGEHLEIVRVLTHLVELETNRGNLEQANAWVDRLSPIATELESKIGATEISIAALGAMGNVLAQIGLQSSDLEALKRAEVILIQVSKLVPASSRIAIIAKASHAQAAWFQDRLSEASQLMLEVVEQATAEFGKLAADAAFNRALVLVELKQFTSARDSILLAVAKYRALGDAQSLAQAEDRLEEFNRL